MSNSNGWDANKIHDNYLESLFNGSGPDGIQVGHSTSIYNNTFKVTEDSTAMSGQHTDNLQLAGNNIKIYGNEFIDIGDSNIDYDAWASGAIQTFIYTTICFLLQNRSILILSLYGCTAPATRSILFLMSRFSIILLLTVSGKRCGKRLDFLFVAVLEQEAETRLGTTSQRVLLQWRFL